MGLLGSRWHILCKASFISQYKRSHKKRKKEFSFPCSFSTALGFLFSIKATWSYYSQKKSVKIMWMCVHMLRAAAAGNEGDARHLLLSVRILGGSSWRHLMNVAPLEGPLINAPNLRKLREKNSRHDAYKPQRWPGRWSQQAPSKLWKPKAIREALICSPLCSELKSIHPSLHSLCFAQRLGCKLPYAQDIFCLSTCKTFNT